MRLLSWLLCAAAALLPVITSEERNLARPKRESSEKKIVCYYTNWSVYRPGTAKFSPQNINPYLCTHLIYAFGGLSKDNALKPFDKYQDIEQGGYAKFNGLKTYNKNLKTMLAIGGWNEGSARFSPLVADAERRKELVKNTVKFLRQNHFDGLDLDWEYPSFRDGGKPRDRDNYATLVQEFREEFERESEKTGRPRLLLTMAVPAGIEYIDKGYDVPKLNKYLDWMNILSYDYHSAFEPAINHHSPLFSLEEDDEYNFDAQLNIDYTVQHYIKLGADRSKLVLGIPTYGRSYTLFNPDATDIGSPADGPGEQGEATREKGYLAYYEICERVKSGGWELENPNPEAMGPYAYKGNQWVGFDDEDIARAKAKYVNDNDLGGIMFWSIDNDDFRGKCHGKPYPLIEAAKEALLANANELVPTSSRSGSSRSNSKKQEEESSSKSKTRKSRLRIKSSTTTEASRSKASARTTTTPQPPTTPDPGSDFVCKDEGFFPHPRDCKKYFWCLDSGPSSLGIVAHQFTCPSGLVFNKISDSCDYARNVICKTKSEASTTTTTTTTSTTTSRTTTARSRLVITASPPRTPSTTTTTTEQPYEDEEESEEDEEDPGTIKELINLIKKLGGVEQLEKQLNLQNSDEKIKPSLYSKVLHGRTGNRYRGVNDEPSTPKYISVFRNRPVGPQSPSTEDTNAGTRGQEKPRYVTIQRNRPTKKPTKVEEEIEEEEDEEEQEQPKKKEETPRPFRRRPNTDPTTEREYTVLRRSRPPKDEEEVSTSKYKNIVRVRSTTEAAAEKDEEEESEISEEEEDVEEEEEEEKVEPGQKFKKYSAIIRDNKKVESDDEEPKVSGPQGPQYHGGVQSSSTTDHTTEERNNVNNVYTITSPRYVEIRRPQLTTTETLANDVNSVNSSPESVRESTQPETEEEEESDNEPEERENNGFQRRFTTEFVRRPTRPTTFEKTTVSSVEPKETESVRFRGRFRSNPTTEPITTVEVKPINRYKTLNRNNPEKSVVVDENELNQLPKRERVIRTSSTTTTTEKAPTSGVPRRFQFAPRTKPTILSPKPVETTTEPFTITVPDLPNPTIYTENSLSSNSPSSYPSATLEPSSATAPSVVDNTFSDAPENNILLTTFAQRKFPSTRYSNPTTSTQTSVVTSITESSFTERRRISIPKKARFKSELGSRLSKTSTTTEEPSETLRPSLRSTGYRTIVRSTTPKTETTKELPRRRFKLKSTSTTTTTTTEPIPEKKYVPKKIRNFKKITSTEFPEVTSSTTERVRFQPRNRPRQADFSQNEPSNSLYTRFGNARRKKLGSNKDDLEVDQTGGFFGSEAGTDKKYVVGGGVRQTSEKDYLNADIFLITVPTVEEEEKSSNTSEEELTNLLDLNKNNAPGKKTDPKDSLIANNPNFRNLRARIRTSTPSPRESTTSTTKTTQSGSTEGTKNNFRTKYLQSNREQIETRTKTLSALRQAAKNNVLNQRESTSPTTSAPNSVEGTENNFRTKYQQSNREQIETRRKTLLPAKQATKNDVLNPRAPIIRFPNKQRESDDSGIVEGLGERESSSNNNRGSRTRTQQDNEIYEEHFPEEDNAENPNENNLETQDFRKLKTRTGRPVITTENPVSSTLEGSVQNKNFRNPRTRGRQFSRVADETVPTTASSLPVRSTKEPTTSYSFNSSQKGFRTLRTRNEQKNEEVTVSSTLKADEASEPIHDNIIVTKSDESFSRTTGPQIGQHSTQETGSTVGLSAETTESSTFGAKVKSAQISTLGLTGYVFSSTGSTADSSIGSTISTTTTSTFLTGSSQGSSKSTLSTVSPPQTGLRTAIVRKRLKERVTEPTSDSASLEPDAKEQVEKTSLTNPSFRNFRARARQNTTIKFNTTGEQQESSTNDITSSNVKVLRTRARGRENIADSATQASETSSLNEITENLVGKDRRRITFRIRPSQSTIETNEKEDDTKLNTSEAPPSPKVTSNGRGTQEYFTNLRNKARWSTQPTTNERTERRRSQLDRRRLRPTTSTSKPEVYTEISSSTSKSTTYLRRRIRPTTSTTTTTTTTTTEEPYIEQQEDSRLEESKTLDETPDIQDLADPAVVAIHNLATVSPGPIGSIGTSSLKVYPETPATYTVHVTPSDIASFSTPARIATVTPGTVSARPTSILTLKPYTIPVITKDYKQTPIAISRTPSPFRVATEEPYSPRSEILIQARRQETTQRTKPTVTIATTSQTTPRSRRLKPYSKLPKQEAVQSVSSPEPSLDYEYYDDDEDPLANIPPSALKVKVHSDGYIECLDRGNFPHPFSCKKFISCAKMENNELLGWEYTCPKHLSFDPVGGICNWSAGLGCQH